MSPGYAARFSIVICSLMQIFQSSQCSPNFWRPTLPPTLPSNPSAPIYKSKLSLLRLKIPAQTEHSYYCRSNQAENIFANDISVSECVGAQSAGLIFCFQLQFCRLEKGMIFSDCIYKFPKHKLYSFQNISLQFIEEIFLKFQARYSYKKKRMYHEWLKSIKQLSKLT